MKDLYYGTFNYCGQIMEYYRHAKSEKEAKWLMIRALSKDLRISIYYLKNYFSGHKDNYYIKKEERNHGREKN